MSKHFPMGNDFPASMSKDDIQDMLRMYQKYMSNGLKPEAQTQQDLPKETQAEDELNSSY